MKEIVLKKEFKPKDVQRMRNIISKKAGDKTQLLSGWEKKIQDYKEGDTWEDNSKQWTIKNGIKQTVTKLDRLKSMSIIPLCCPNCKKPMKLHDLNKKMYAIHKICFDCVIDMEAEIKKQGNWQAYVSNQRNLNKTANLEDFERFLESWMLQKDSFVSEGGDVESWSGGDKTTIYKEVKEWIEEQKSLDL